MDSALIYEDPWDRLLAAIIGRSIKDYVVARKRGIMSRDGLINERVLAKIQRAYSLKPASLLGCNRLEIRTAYLFMYEGGLDVLLAALAPNQDPNLIRQFAEDAIKDKREIFWK